MGSKGKEIVWLPYGHLIMKVLDHIGLNVLDEESLENSTRIGNSVVRDMRIEINNGMLTKNPPKVRRAAQIQAQKKAHQHEGSSNLENFDYKIPRTPPTEAFL